MRIVVLTWEFPPFIAGGLGMACYGLVKSLLSLGTEIDLILPTREEVYFPMRRPEDADIMPVEYLDPSRRIFFKSQTKSNMRERLLTVGVSAYPESYIAPEYSFESLLEALWETHTYISDGAIEKLKAHLRGHEPIFKKVREFASRIAKFSRHMDFDIIHAHDWLTYPAGIALKGITGRKLIAHIHATEFDRAGGPGDERIHNIEYTGLSSADLVIAVSKYTAEMVIDRYRIEPYKLRVVHNAYSVSTNNELRKEKIFSDPLVLFLGRVTLQKGPDYFLEVAERVLKRYPRVRFVMAGTGDMFFRMLRSSANKRLKDRFLFTSFLNREQVEKILSATDIFIMPSVSEPFGIVPLEAMAFGAVAIVSKQSGVSEVVKNVFKIDFWDVDKTVDVMLDLLENPEKMKEMAEAGRREVLAIGWQKAAEETTKIYEAIRCSI